MQIFNYSVSVIKDQFSGCILDFLSVLKIDEAENHEILFGVALVNFCLWVELLHLRAQQGGLRPFCAFDEPFLALRPERFPLVAAIFQACADSGVQLLVVTNQEGMIPEGARHVHRGGS